MESKEEIANRFLQLVNKNYDEYKKKWISHNNQKGMTFDEDVFSQTILSIYDKIKKSGINDSSDKGLENYFFKSVIMNNKRELLYPYQSRRDKNVEPFDVLKNTFDDSDLSMIKKEEARKSFFQYHILKTAQDNFDLETFKVFRLFYLDGKMTYTKLTKLTGVKNAKKKILEVRNWLQNNISKEELNKEFEIWYDLEHNNFW